MTPEAPGPLAPFDPIDAATQSAKSVLEDRDERLKRGGECLASPLPLTDSRIAVQAVAFASPMQYDPSPVPFVGECDLSPTVPGPQFAFAGLLPTTKP